MSVLHKIITLSLVLLCLGACSDDGSGDIVRRIDEDGNAFSPASLQGSIEYLPSMNAEMVRVVRLDDKLIRSKSRQKKRMDRIYLPRNCSILNTRM